MITFELRELAVQAKISQIEFLTRDDLLGELEDNYWNCLELAIIEHHGRYGTDLASVYFHDDHPMVVPNLNDAKEM